MERPRVDPQVAHRPVRPEDVPQIAVLLRAGEEVDGRAPFSDDQRIALRNVTEPSQVGSPEPIGVFVTERAPGSGLVGYGQLLSRPGGRWLEAVVHPGHRRPAEGILSRIVGEALRSVGAGGGGTVHCWLHDPADHERQVAQDHGLRLDRTLLQMRCPLPVPIDRRTPAAVSLPPLRAFQPGRDDDGWLEVNNRAFADHPEQGSWDLAMLHDRQAETWFDPEGFLVLEEDGRISASCWTKLETEDGIGLVGEIYVISVDSSQQGRGLGRLLTTAGLDWLAEHGAVQGMLYVDADNGPAVSLYRSLGFVEDHTDLAYTVTVTPA